MIEAAKVGAWALALSLAPAIDTLAPPGASYTLNDNIRQVICPYDDGIHRGTSRGTAFRIGPNRLVSVNHVTRYEGCAIDGQPFRVTYADEALDLSMIEMDAVADRWMARDCEGFKDGDMYFAIGFAKGLPDRRIIPLRYSALLSKMASIWYKDGAAVLVGPQTVIPGQSGGPITNRANAVAGTVNAYFDPIPGLPSISFSRPLKDTPVCQP